MPEQFYKEEYFSQLHKRIDNIDLQLETLSKKIDTVDSKVTYIYAWASGIGVAAAFISNYLIK